jgi:DNA-binding LacI/PurR family transcriptional regulator
MAREGLCYSVDRRGMFLARELPSVEAQSLTVGLVLSYGRHSEEDNPFYRTLYEGAEIEANRRRHNVLSLCRWRRKDPLQKAREVEQFRQQLAGFLALGVYDERDCLRLRDSGVPTVAVDYETLDLGIDCAVIDNHGLMRALCAAVLERRPGPVFLADFVRATAYDPALVDRRRAFTETMAAAGRDGGEAVSIFVAGRGGVCRGLEGLRAAAENGGRPAAICTDDFVAQKLLEALAPEGPRPGKDFSLAYIGSPRPAYAEMLPALIGAVDFRELGRTGMLLLEERIAAGPGRAQRRAVGGEVVDWPGEGGGS